MGITAQERADVRWLPARSLAREPLLWAAVAAILGAAIGLAGNLRLVTWFGGMNVPGSPPPALVWLVGEADTESLLRQLGHTERGIGR